MSVADRLRALAAERILLTDGAFGTMIQRYNLDEAAYRGDLALTLDQKGNNDMIVLTQPRVVAEITRAYLDAGTDIASTNTFNANRVSQADYGAEALVREMNIAAASIAREEAEAAQQRDGRPRFVAGAIGPTNKTLSLSPDVNDPGYRAISFDELKEVYREQAEALLDGGADLLLIETIFDTLNAKAGIMAVLEAGEARGARVPLMLSMTITDLSGRNLSGHSVEAFWAAVRHARPLAVGLNCSFGAPQLRPHAATLARQADTLLLAYPNAGLPNDLGQYDELPAETARMLGEWADAGLLNIVGGCCGTTPEHIAAIVAVVAGKKPRALPQPPVRTVLAGLDPMVLAA